MRNNGQSVPGNSFHPAPAGDFSNNTLVYYKSTHKSRDPERIRPLEIRISADEANSELNHVRKKLMYDLHSIFCKTQTVAIASQGTLRLEDAAVLSQRYRLAIRNALKLLEDSDGSLSRKQKMADELISAETIWSLFESVCIRPTSHSIVVDLVEWGRECFASASEVLSTLMDDISAMEPQDKPERHELYWNALIQQVLSGDFKAAANLLKFNSKYETDSAFQRMALIFQKMDVGLLRDRSSSEEFIEGQRAIRELLQSGVFRQHDNLNFLYAVLRGQKGAFQRCAQTLSVSWYELLPAYVLFCHPTAQAQEIGQIAEELIQLTGKSRNALPPLDSTLLSILKLNYLEALKDICSGSASFQWFATHLIDLLYFHDPSILIPKILMPQSTFGALLSNNTTTELGLRSRILSEYASSLFTAQMDNLSEELWELAADYFVAAGAEQTREILEERVSGLDWRGNTKLAERIISICDKHDLLNAKYDITRAVTLKYLMDKEWSTALGWALRNGSTELISHVARKLLVHSSPEQISQMRIFDAMSDAFLVSPELILLYKFYTFKRHLYRGELREAMVDLHQLFVDNSSPPEFHALPTLDKNAVSDMFRALSMFEQYQKIRLGGDPPPPKAPIQERIEELTKILRPLLCNVLATSSLN
ncbi:nup85 nucleoporin domain-containing protein [Ditylenchus destructor]|uniref:Nuclear pore complex protein Nup85 n=1 Tax=Ditylenchus destructor TaxID=166010 RepID=A0AAD4NKK2_9BILA|nr:nup85 nucleoporin domain-containing protein [Ditylenchus destructor]